MHYDIFVESESWSSSSGGEHGNGEGTSEAQTDKDKGTSEISDRSEGEGTTETFHDSNNVNKTDGSSLSSEDIPNQIQVLHKQVQGTK